MEELMKEISAAIIEGQVDRVGELTRRAIQNGAAAKEVLADGLISGMDVVGRRFKAGDMFVPEVLLSAKAMHAGLDVLRPLLSESDRTSLGKVLIGTVKGDLHDIGKNLVAMMLEGAGFEVKDLGVDVEAGRFVEEAKAYRPDVLGMSALLTTTMPEMEGVLGALEEAGIRDDVKVIVGGAPVTQDFADKIKADGYAPDASAAVQLVRELVR